MSGGSFNYLCFVDADEIGQRLSALDEMAGALDGICPEAAAATREVAAHVCGAQSKIDALKDMWHAVEWWYSSDWSRDQVAESATRYRADRAAAEPGLSPALQKALAAAQNHCNGWHHVEIGQRWTGERLYDLLPCLLDKHDSGVPHRDPAGNSW